MVLLAYTIFTTTLVLQRKQAARGLALGLASLTSRSSRCSLLSRLLVEAVFVAALGHPPLPGTAPARGPELPEPRLERYRVPSTRPTPPISEATTTVRTAHPDGTPAPAPRPPGSAGAATAQRDPRRHASAAAAAAGRPAQARASAAGATGTGGSAGRRRHEPHRHAPGPVAASAARPYQHRSFVERYRGVIIGVAAVAAVALIGGLRVFARRRRRPTPARRSVDPAPTPSPAADASPQPGYLQPDMGPATSPSATKVNYTYCPPASGNALQRGRQRPDRAARLRPRRQSIPQGWVHNLEHGALVLLYRGDSAGATPAGPGAQLRAFFDSFPTAPSAASSRAPSGTGLRPVRRHDEPFTALVWDRVLPLQTLDTQAILEFYQVRGERTNPEQLCSPSRSAGPSAVPSGSRGAERGPERVARRRVRARRRQRTGRSPRSARRLAQPELTSRPRAPLRVPRTRTTGGSRPPGSTSDGRRSSGRRRGLIDDGSLAGLRDVRRRVAHARGAPGSARRCGLAPAASSRARSSASA